MSTKYRLRDISKFTFGASLGLFVGFGVGQTLYEALFGPSGLGNTVLALAVVILVVSVPTFLIQLPISAIVLRLQKASFEQLPDDQQQHETVVTGMVRKIMCWSFLAGSTVGMAEVPMQAFFKGAL
ncbi:MAG: hypothetical protein AB3N22_10290 [Ruegeria sp.]